MASKRDEYVTKLKAQLDRWNAEMPTEVHSSGVWRDRVSGREEREGKHALGGSLLGSPRLNEGFRRLLESSPFETEYAVMDGQQQKDEHYVRPLRAAIARIGHRHPEMAEWLLALGFAGFDWPALVLRRGLSLEVGEVYLESCCYILWREFDLAPRVGTSK